jgi:hypothetical protein
MRDRDDDDAGAGCLFCRRGAGGGEHYPFHAGFCVDYKETRAFLSDTTHVRAKYRDLKRYSLRVCDACAGELRRRHHLPGLIRWGAAFVGCVVGAVVVVVLNVAGDQMVYVLGILGLFGVLTGIVAGIELLHLAAPSSSPAVSVAVLERVKKDPEFRNLGDSFFGPEEYRILFKDAREVPLTADEILARERAEGGGPKRKKAKARDAADVQTCPHCRRAIPGYARACPHCKKVLG